MKRHPLPVGVLAVLAILVAGVVIALSLRDSTPVVAVAPPDDGQLLLQAERNPPGFIVRCGTRPWREQPAMLRAVLATMHFELALVDLQGLALGGASAPPTAAELDDAYRQLALPEAIPLVAAYAAVPQPAAAKDPALLACKARYRALLPRITAARKAYLSAHLDDLHQALNP